MRNAGRAAPQQEQASHKVRLLCKGRKKRSFWKGKWVTFEIQACGRKAF